MRIAADVGAPKTPPPKLPAEPSQGGVSFKALLGHTGQHDIGALGFGEPGVLGANRSSAGVLPGAWSPQPDKTLSLASRTPAIPEEALDGPIATAAPSLQGLADRLAQVLSRAGASLAADKVGRDAKNTSALGAWAGEIASVIGPGAPPPHDAASAIAWATDTDQDRATGAKLPIRPQRPPAPNVSVLVSEQNGSVQIVVAAAGVGADSSNRLRRITAAIAAEFGLTMSGFSLNGAAIDGSTTEPKGVLNGHRTR